MRKPINKRLGTIQITQPAHAFSKLEPRNGQFLAPKSRGLLQGPSGAQKGLYTLSSAWSLLKGKVPNNSQKFLQHFRNSTSLEMTANVGGPSSTGGSLISICLNIRTKSLIFIPTPFQKSFFQGGRVKHTVCTKLLALRVPSTKSCFKSTKSPDSFHFKFPAKISAYEI